jgi:flagellar motor switch protein FliG
MSPKKEFSGAHKVAAFLLSLDKDISARVMKALDPKAIPDVAEAMTGLDRELCSPEAVDQLYMDVARAVYQRTGVRAQDDFELLVILENVFGADEAERVVRSIHERRRQAQPFGFLESAPSETVARVLVDESPMVIALVLAHVSPKLSAEVLGALQPEQALVIVRRMTTLVPPPLDTMLLIAGGLEERLRAASTGPAPRDPANSLRTVAELLNFSNTATEKVVLEGLQKDDEGMAQEIREFMFRWESLAEVDKRAMQKILASIDTKTLSMSLKGSPPAVEENILKNLSTRVRDMVIDERQLTGAVPMSEVLTARAEIMKAVRALIEAGEFRPARAGEEMVS